ncbi:MAG: hypothetical protein J6126_05050 [Clostridia bacterium]|nr:hypothetical protein [Clostridia bacterium]
MKRTRKYFLFVIPFVLALAFTLSGILGITTPTVAYAANKTTYTRQGDTVWFGYYPQTKATDEEVAKMSATADEDGYYTSGKDKFVKVTSADPKLHSETADTDYIPFDDDSQPVPGATYYFKMEPIEWKVMVDDDENNAVKLVSKKYLDTHAWLTEFVNGDYWANYYNTLDGVPENTPANGWRYSEIRAWLNDGFLNTAFTEEEQKSIFVFANKNTIDYRKDDPDTIVNDYIAVGDRSDYDAAGDDGRPTDYAIVKGATWCYNKDHIYYWVNDDYPMFPSNTLRLYRHDEHNKCTYADSVEAVRPILYAKRSDAKILATATQKEEKQADFLLIFGIIAAVLGAAAAVPMMIITRARYKKLPPEQQKGKFPYKKHEVPLIACGLVLLIGGLLMIFLPIAINGGGIGGGKLQPGIYVQQGQYSGGDISQVGHTAYRLNADGTFDYSDSYENNIWSGHGTWKQSGSTVTFVWKGNPMVAEGYTYTATIYDGGSSFGNSSERFKRIN